ncbi:anaerobic ribonucleoside triphosphate reductase|uniref:Ribonucleoside-triphosphate reductase class III catalytic subunit n=1 Tax=Dendrosporobacter quercicolus TaxID=146817 RepID=A0A1G9KGA3_9FIRM|nr:anaerobic ribonucleoside triphosphate reductase [Dendrosporobacter quercicolus]NSL49750.1 anaerobic ribonucleoside triphosphate reductase [Dendrosporobacter quercicolus DSM 1736]SDL48554.1 ribonucleoside-triphosphate reductase class III catalytic subunit [Dendrosporobacter quercicolus]
MNNLLVIKRDGRKSEFHTVKVYDAIQKAYTENFDGIVDTKKVKALTEKVVSLITESGKQSISVEEIQDIVEDVLIRSREVAVAKKYIGYRAQRTQIREANMRLMLEYKDITFKDAEQVDSKRENANVDGNTAMGTMLQYGATGSKQFVIHHILKNAHALAHQEGVIHIHDMDFEAIGTLTCCQIDIHKLFKNGFSTGHGHLREPQDIMSYAALAAIAIQSNQNDQHGGQSIPNFDYGLAPGVAKTFVRLYKDNLTKAVMLQFDSLPEAAVEAIVEKVVDPYQENAEFPRIGETHYALYRESETVRLRAALQEAGVELDEMRTVRLQTTVYRFARNETMKKTYQAMEGFLHNLNTMHSRAGAQVPFSSVNFGTDVSPEGKLVAEQFLLSVERGLGNGETAIFPISIFKVKEGINYNPQDPNYDLFKLSCRVSAKRLFPNFVFLDAPFNLQYYQPGRPETEVATMGCRTRVVGSVFPESDGIVFGRGNLSFTSINLPRLGIKYGIARGEREQPDLTGFYRDLDEVIDLVIAQLLERYEIQKNKKVKNFPFLMGQNIWYGAEQLNWEDRLEEVIKHGTLTAGFIGLAETLKALTGSHHGETAEAQNLGLEIIGHLRRRMDEAANAYQLNFSLIATPAEGLSGRFVKIDHTKFGGIPGVTDREYYTNGFHIPVYFPISASRKIELEAPYHAFTNAGHITYIELDGDMTKNPDAFELVVRKMKESNIGYGSINHPVDRDPACGFTGVIGDICPKCGRKEQGPGSMPFERIRRITGYLVGTMEKWNNGKRAEEKDRVKHLDGRKTHA